MKNNSPSISDLIKFPLSDQSTMAHPFQSLKNQSKKTFSSLYIRNYRMYYIGQIISTSGTFMQGVAQAWLVLQLTGSGTALGVVASLQYVPILILAPIGGVLVDRFSKRKILYFTQTRSRHSGADSGHTGGNRSDSGLDGLSDCLLYRRD